MTAKRRYDASRRRAAAEERRTRVAEVAAAMFAERGWSATTIAAVAAEAGVSGELVSTAFGGKAGLLMAALRHRTLGGRTLTEAFGQLDLASEQARDARLDRFVAFACDTLERIAPLFTVLTIAADQDPEVRDLIAPAEERHVETIRGALRVLAPGPVSADVEDELVVLTRSEVYLGFRRHRGWSRERYAAWLRARLVALVDPEA